MQWLDQGPALQFRLRVSGALTLLFGLTVAPAGAADLQDTVMRAMRDELARSMAELRLSGLEQPYFISYRVSNLLVSAAGGRGSSRVEPAILAVKVFPDGREEPLRNLEIAGIDAPSFKDILVAGREPFLNTVPFRGTICSFAVPSLLFEDLTLKKPAAEIGRPPIAKHPFFDQ